MRLQREDEDKPLALSAADGRLAATISIWKKDGVKLRFQLVESFHARSSFERVLRPGETCDLGDLVLAPGARIRGSVLDERGAGLGGAWVISSRKSILPRLESERDASFATTAKDGSFVLEGVPAGTSCVTAYGEHRGAVEQCGLEPVLGRELGGVVITLGAEEQDESGLLVRVLQPSGDPLPGARTENEVREGERTSIGVRSADKKGCFHIAGGPTAVADIVVTDPQLRYVSAFAAGVPIAQRTLEIELEAGTPHTLLVTDEQGAPIESFAFRVLQEPQYHPASSGAMLRDTNGLLRDLFIGHGIEGPYAPRAQERKQHAEGRAEFAAGSLAFCVQADAAGFKPGEAGPFLAGAAPAEIRLALQRLPGIRGRVVSGGAPVAGAWVRLFQAAEENRSVLVDGNFPSRILPVLQAQTTSAADGAFELPLRDAGDFIVGAGREQLGEVQSAKLALVPRDGRDGLVLELPGIGAIEGRLLVAPGEDARDRVVGASSGNGHARSVRTDAEGRFRFDELSAGTWLLRPLGEDIDPAGEGYEVRGGSTPTQMPSSCVVRANETTRLEIDLAHKAEFVAHIGIPELADGQWTASLDPVGASFSRRATLAQVEASKLRLSVDQAGEYALRIEVWKPELHGRLSVEERVHLLAGTNEWTLAGPAGELTVASTLDAKAYPQLRCETSTGRVLSLYLDLGAREEFVLHGVPAGHWTRVHYDLGKLVEDAALEIGAAAPARVEWK